MVKVADLLQTLVLVRFTLRSELFQSPSLKSSGVIAYQGKTFPANMMEV